MRIGQRPTVALAVGDNLGGRVFTDIVFPAHMLVDDVRPIGPESV